MSEIKLRTVWNADGVRVRVPEWRTPQNASQRRVHAAVKAERAVRALVRVLEAARGASTLARLKLKGGEVTMYAQIVGPGH